MVEQRIENPRVGSSILPQATRYTPQFRKRLWGFSLGFQRNTRAATPQSICLGDGELVLYRRSRSLLYQCRYRIADGSWVRQTTGKAALEHAIVRACDIYDEARYRERLELAHLTHSVAQIAEITSASLRQQIDAKGKKTALNDYVSNIERYFVPYFGERQLETLTHTGIREFEMWRDRQMTRKPKTSTRNNFTSVWGRLVAKAEEQGFISKRVTYSPQTRYAGTSPAAVPFRWGLKLRFDQDTRHVAG